MSAFDGFGEFPFAQQQYARVELDGQYDDDEARKVGVSLYEANMITSRIDARPGWGWHRPVLDIDMPAVVIPSSTPGHGHLYIDQPMSWERYARLLRALAGGGIVEPGYVNASIEREHTAVRLPWVRK